MRILVLNKYGPDSGAPTGRLMGELVEDLNKGGLQALWICEDSQYADRDRRVLRRLWNDLRVYWEFWRTLRSLSVDVIVAMTDPPFLPILVAWYAKRKGLKSVIWCQDIYPEIAVRAGVLPRWLAWPLERLMWCAWKHSTVVAIGRCMKAYLASQGVASECIPNWVDGGRFPYRASTGTTRAYIGHYGTIHQLTDHPPQPHYYGLTDGELREIAQATDIHIVTLRGDMLGLAVPSKVYTALACGRHVEWLGPKDSEGFLIIKEAGADRLSTPCWKIRTFHQEHCDRPVQTAKWLNLLTAI